MWVLGKDRGREHTQVTLLPRSSTYPGTLATAPPVSTTDVTSWTAFIPASQSATPASYYRAVRSHCSSWQELRAFCHLWIRLSPQTALIYIST